MNLAEYIRDIPDFPKKGIVFKDVTPLLGNGEVFNHTIEMLSTPYEGEVDIVVGIEARGFIFASPVAIRLGAGFVPARKVGKLPYEIIKSSYDLEYGSDGLEMHKDSIKPGDKVLIIDDVLATGGTAKAVIDMVESLGGVVVGLSFLLEIQELKGKDKIDGYEIKSLIKC